MTSHIPINESPPIQAYAYSYPHKSSYQPISPSVPISEIWRDEDVHHLSLYVHIPFCEMRCGFCNLFTQSQPHEDLVDQYVNALVRQIRVIRKSVPDASFGQFAVGGGTPTFLSAVQLQRIFREIENAFDLSTRQLPTSVETSPATATEDRLSMLREIGVQRISLGVQSFVKDEMRGLGRPQSPEEAKKALRLIRATGFPVLNIDLIYGDAEQTEQSWSNSLQEALQYRPEELYLYPLYIRPETGLAKAGCRLARHRSDLYRCAREFLLTRGYVQTSLRCFRLPGNIAPSSYACQRDGMIGLGCGARSYTRRVHYATRFAVTQAGVKAILSDWIQQSDQQLSQATHGIFLTQEEQRRRYLIMSLLQAEGMRILEYESRFQSSPFEDFPELEELRTRDWLDETSPEILRLNDLGLEHSDDAGPLLYSSSVRARLQEFVRL
jgi:oxygen-independent coproporphyrinogen-3 oxidase